MGHIMVVITTFHPFKSFEISYFDQDHKLPETSFLIYHYVFAQFLEYYGPDLTKSAQYNKSINTTSFQFLFILRVQDNTIKVFFIISN